MNGIAALLERRRLVLTVAGVLSLVGAVMWLTMIRQEDPRLPDFWGQVTVPFPGASAGQVERLVLEPIEDALAEVDEIKEIRATAFEEMALLVIELHGGTADFDKAWDEVRDALEKARRDFPASAGRPVLDEQQQDQDSVVLAVTGSPDPLHLLDGARRLKDALLAVPGVSRVHLIADPGEQVTVALDDAVEQRLAVGAPQLAAQLTARNRILPGGSLHLGDKSVRLRPLSEFGSVEEIADTPVVLPSGSTVPLDEVARVHLGPVEPVRALMRLNGEMGVAVAVVPRKAVNLVAFGRALRDTVADTASRMGMLQVREVTFQPQRTEARLAELNRSLMFGILIVAGVLFLAMGLRMGLVVASVVPLVAMASLTLFAWGGGVLHQISIAALVLALGMLVDNAIVVAENVQWRLDRGNTAADAAVGAVGELAVPLAGATATTLAAFLPMLIADGPTAAFTRSIPVVIMLTLTISYLFAVCVTPILSQMVLKTGSGRRSSMLPGLGRRLAAIAVGRPGWVLTAAFLLVGLAVAGAGQVRQQFFPSSDRNQMVLDLKLPEGAHIEATDQAARRIETALLDRPEVVKVASFVGRSAPKFYYNIMRVPFSPHLAQMIVETRSVADIGSMLDWIRAFTTDQMPQVELVARKLEQGPPVDAPVEVRLFGTDFNALHTAADQVSGLLRTIPGTQDVRHDMGPGAPTVRFAVDDAAAARYGLTRADLARALYGRTRGLPVGELYISEDPIPVVIRSSAGENLTMAHLETTGITARNGSLVPLAQVARLETVWRPAVIRHRDGRRVVTVSSQLAEGATFSQVLDRLAPRLDALQLPPGVAIRLGGDAEGSGEANTALMRSFPMGILVLLGVLLAEFNSFRRVGIILVTVPLAAAGVVPGLLLNNQPFGFMSLLGVIALVGIVVNNAIVLLEVVDARRREGASLDQALIDAVARRIRPILLTTATTVAGLLPLAFSPSTLWPPLATAMISGLIAATLLTLVVVPAMTKLMFHPTRRRRALGRTAAASAAAVVAAILISVPGPAWAGAPLKLGLDTAMQRAGDRPAAEAARARADAADQTAEAARRAGWWPTLGSSLSGWTRDRDLNMSTPIGSFPSGDRQGFTGGVELTQPIIDPARQWYRAPAAAAEARAEHLQSRRTRQELAAAAAQAYLSVLAIDASTAVTEAYIRSIDARLTEIREMVATGRALESDALKLVLSADQARQDKAALANRRRVAVMDLARSVHHDGPVVPDPAPDLLSQPVPAVDASTAQALDDRPDLAALQESGLALDRQIEAVRAETLPTLAASASWSWADGSPYEENQWIEGAVTLRWVPFAAGTRRPRQRALAAQRRALAGRIRETRRGIGLEVSGAIARLQTAHGAYTVAERGVEMAAETLRVERERHLSGRATTNDLLEAEASLRDRRTRRELARLEVVSAWVQLWLATGRGTVLSDLGSASSEQGEIDLSTFGGST